MATEALWKNPRKFFRGGTTINKTAVWRESQRGKGKIGSAKFSAKKRMGTKEY